MPDEWNLPAGTPAYDAKGNRIGELGEARPNGTWSYSPTPIGVFTEARKRGGAFGRGPSWWQRIWTRVTLGGVRA